MSKNNDIDDLMKQYLHFYQQNHQTNEAEYHNDFDNLMIQYKSKFDQQIAREQKNIKAKEEAQFKQKKVADSLPSQEPKQSSQLRKHKPNHSEREIKRNYQKADHKHSYRGIIILIIIVIVISLTLLLTSRRFGDSSSLNNQIRDVLFTEPLAEELNYVDNINIDGNYPTACSYLHYVDNGSDYADLIDLSLDDDDFLVTNNNSQYYLYLEYNDAQYTHNLLVKPYDFNYDTIFERNNITINKIAFYQFEDPALASLDPSLDIDTYTTLEPDDFTETNAEIIFKHYYYTSCLRDHRDDLMFIRKRGSDMGYYGYLDYTNQVINVYYTDELDSDLTVENIQNYQSDYLKTITL